MDAIVNAIKNGATFNLYHKHVECDEAAWERDNSVVETEYRYSPVEIEDGRLVGEIAYFALAGIGNEVLPLPLLYEAVTGRSGDDRYDAENSTDEPGVHEEVVAWITSHPQYDPAMPGWSVNVAPPADLLKGVRGNPFQPADAE